MAKRPRTWGARPWDRFAVATVGAFAAVMTATVATGCADGGIAVESARVAESANGTNMAVYATIENRGPADELVALRTGFHATGSLHEMREEGGMTSMHETDGIAVEAGATVSLEPGRRHGMLTAMDVIPQAGDTVELTFVFASGLEVQVRAPVVSFADLADPSEHAH